MMEKILMTIILEWQSIFTSTNSLTAEKKFVETRENVKYEEDESLKHGDPGKAKGHGLCHEWY